MYRPTSTAPLTRTVPSPEERRRIAHRANLACIVLSAVLVVIGIGIMLTQGSV